MARQSYTEARPEAGSRLSTCVTPAESGIPRFPR